jgi:hypothetical protein
VNRKLTTISSTLHSGTLPLRTASMSALPQKELVVLSGLPSFWFLRHDNQFGGQGRRRRNEGIGKKEKTHPTPYAKKPGIIMSIPASAGCTPLIVAAQSETTKPGRNAKVPSVICYLRTNQLKRKSSQRLSHMKKKITSLLLPHEREKDP